MTVITLYKYTRADGGVDVSRTQPDGETVTTCDNNVWAPGVYGWTEV